MLIPSSTAGDPYVRAAALERALRSPGAGGTDATSDDGGSPPSSPDVVVTLGQGPASPGTYDAAGRMAAPPTLDDLGANAPDPMAQATEADADEASAAPADADVAA